MGIQSIGNNNNNNNKTDVDVIIASLMADDKFIVSDNICKTGKVLSRLIGPTFDIAKNLMTISEVASSSTAMNAIISSSTAMNAIASSSTAMNAIAKSSTASAAINAAIQNYRSALLSALADTSKFTKTTTIVGNGAGKFTHGLNTNTIYIPVNCNDDYDTDYKIYSGVDDNNVVVSINRHGGTIDISSGVCLRGTTVIGDGASIGYVTFDIYTAI